LSEVNEASAASALLALEDYTMKINECSISATPLEQNDTPHKEVSKRTNKKEKPTVRSKLTVTCIREIPRQTCSRFNKWTKDEKIHMRKKLDGPGCEI
jgi:hypothetical protein